jgi:methylmalonyl-CoA mutase N-terminal domain/subunit
MLATENAQSEKQVDVHIVLRRQDGRWSATAVDYSVVGQGASAEEAIDEVVSGVVSYLRWCLRDGLSLEEARRPIGWRWRLELDAYKQVERVRHLLNRPSSVRDTHVAAPLAYC